MNQLSRRHALKASTAGFGYLAFAGLSTLHAKQETKKAEGQTHHPARAKRVIFLCMDGAPSHVDTFDYKPKLTRDHGKTMKGARARSAKLLGSPWNFDQHGESGLWISELFPQLAAQADHLCMLHGMHTDVPAHPQAFLQMHTGTAQFKRPSLGSWAFYGLGTENENLPGFVTIGPTLRNGGPANYGSAFLPAVTQGTPIRTSSQRFARRYRRRSSAAPSTSVSNISNPRFESAEQRRQLDFVQSLNRDMLLREKEHAGVEGAIESLELAFRMQSELPDVMDLSQERSTTLDDYGINDDATRDFGRKCLLARRFVESGVRFVEVSSGQWDHHRNLRQSLANKAESIDRPVAALLKDLANRGLLEDTLVLWGGEFGRTPYAQGDDGRDHNHRGYTTWMAGAGVKGGYSYGATDEYGYQAVEGRVHTHDWHATILHLLGIDHERLTYRHAGRDMRLTDVKGNVISDIMS